MSARHQGEIAVIAGIVALIPHAIVPDFLVRDLETMTGRADECTGVAADAV
jgi:hypothetical protein